VLVHAHRRAPRTAAATRILGMRRRPTALFCANDELALGALAALRAHGMQCPRDLSIIGFDDMPAAQYAAPPLTTIAQPLENLVRTALEQLLNNIHGLPVRRTSVLPVHLVQRASVAAPSR
jgi:DNA-binding LacI/PurR family transcriptional regulator